MQRGYPGSLRASKAAWLIIRIITDQQMIIWDTT